MREWQAEHLNHIQNYILFLSDCNYLWQFHSLSSPRWGVRNEERDFIDLPNREDCA